MYFCQICGSTFQTNQKLITHIRLRHTHESNFKLRCEFCSKTFIVLNSYRSHMFRVHANKDTKYSQNIPKCLHCNYTCLTRSQLLVHCRKHINVGITVTCPFLNCFKKYKVYSSFVSHISRYHRNIRSSCNKNVSVDTSVFSGENVDLSNVELDKNTPFIEVNELERYFGLLLLKFQSKYNMPSKTVQSILTDINGLINLFSINSMDHLYDILIERSELKDIDRENFMKLLSSNFDNVMRLFDTEFKRYKYYTNEFSLITPRTVNLGLNQYNKKCNFQYVPLSLSLKQLFKHEDIVNQIMTPEKTYNGIIADYTDGQFYQPNSDKRKVLDILYFFDDFQIANPLGSHRSKHKISGFYYILGNLHRNSRSSLKIIQLNIVCRSVDLKYFGLESILQPLIMELSELDETGLEIPGIGTFYCKFRFCSADNLGSHQLGGFCESFSSNILRICRSCLITSSQIQEIFCMNSFKLRTPQNYDRHLSLIEADSNLKKIYGIKFPSPLNKIPGFHVTQGLPPDLMHDLFEGIVPYEICLILLQLIEQNFFTLDFLNERIVHFKYNYLDSRNKPEIQKLEKQTLIGTASQNWTFLRLLPLIIGPWVPINNPVWLFFLQLKHIVEIILAPAFTIGHIDILNSEIENHLHEFKKLFPHCLLKPKHHYVMHYPQHILNFGPPITYWCFRFEAKHKLFKDIAHCANQYKNVPYTLAFRHQLKQCLHHQSLNFLFSEFEVKTTTMHLSLLELNIQQLIKVKIKSDNILNVTQILIAGTEYRNGDIVVIDFVQGEPLFGKIEVILLHEKDVWFLFQKCQHNFIPHYGMYSLILNGSYDCIAYESLFYWNPLPCYSVNDNNLHSKTLTLVLLKHMIFDIRDFVE